MRIINIILTSQNGGAEQCFIDYSVVLKNLGHEVLAIIKNDAPYADKVYDLGIEVRKIKNSFGDYDFFASKEIAKIAKEFDADAVFAHVGRSVVLVRRALRKIKNKKVFLVAINHSMNVKRSIGADLILSVNKEIFYRTVQFGQPESRSFVMPNAVDLADALQVAPKINLVKKKKIILGVIGRLDKAKGFRYAVKTLKKLEKFPDKEFVLKIGGVGPRKDFLVNLIKELNLEDKVEFLGWIDKKSFFSQIDILIFPSQRETFGLVLLEGMKFCKPIISTSADGPREILRNEIDALIVDVEPLDNTEERIAEAVIKLVSDAELANKLVENSLVRVKEKFSYDTLSARLKEIVGELRNC